jgi:CheY-like chemotaxis protein
LVRTIPSPKKPGANPRLTILFAEREVVARNLIRIFLQRNYDVLFAADGNEALALSREYLGTIDILLSDLELASRGGLSLQSLIGAERPGIRILSIRGRFLESSGSDSPPSHKPFEFAVLHDKLTELSASSVGTYNVLKTVLVIDSDASRLERIIEILSGNYSVLTANSSAEAQQITGRNSPIDVVIDSESISRLPHPFTPAALLSLVRVRLEKTN